MLWAEFKMSLTMRTTLHEISMHALPMPVVWYEIAYSAAVDFIYPAGSDTRAPPEIALPNFGTGIPVFQRPIFLDLRATPAGRTQHVHDSYSPAVPCRT